MRATHRLRRSVMCFVGATLVGLAAACGGSAETHNAPLRVWALVDPQNEPVVRQGIEKFNKHSKVQAEFSAFLNDWYSMKLRTAIGALNTPDVFFNWGGGNLAQFVEEGLVADLTARWRRTGRRQVHAQRAGRRQGQRQAVRPADERHPAGDAVLQQERSSPPPASSRRRRTTICSRSSTRSARAASSRSRCAGSQGWTELMWLEYLLDRIGGAGEVRRDRRRQGRRVGRPGRASGVGACARTW